MADVRHLFSIPLLNNSVAESVVSEITSRSGRYYYFLGAVINPKKDRTISALATDNLQFERRTRHNMIMATEIKPADVSYVVPRVNWEANVVYDMFDDAYSDKISGINLLSGGANYSNTDTFIHITGGGGGRAIAEPVIKNGEVTYINLIEGGNQYISTPNIEIIDSSGHGSGAVAEAIMSFTLEGHTRLQDSNFYVITDDRNIYKCLDNNEASPSVDKPIDVSPEPFFTNDGYLWKYMGTISTFMSNKFMTDKYIPIKNALTERYYSSGEIRYVVMENHGSGYNFADITVVGDGNLKEEKYRIGGLTITNPGENYTFGTLSISAPVSGALLFVPNKKYYADTYINADDRFYKVRNTGLSGSTEPIHRFGTVSNGELDLEYIAETVTANLICTNGEITAIDGLDGSIHDITITNAGTGYITAPDIVLEGSDAIAYSTISNGHLSRIVVVDPGHVQTAPNVIIGRQWNAGDNVNQGEQIAYDLNLYTVTESGQLGNIEPQVTSGFEINGTANLEYAGKTAHAYSTVSFGYGFQEIPTVFIDGDGSNAEISVQVDKTQARMIPIIEDGSIRAISVVDGGEGYSTAKIIINGDGQGAQARVELLETDILTNQATSELTSKDGAIHVIKVLSNGYGYSSANVTIEGDGIGAKAIPIINNNKIRSIEVTDEGSGYTWARIIIDGPGTGATARAILPPIGGHGRDPVKELFACSLAFYTNMGEEKVQGLPIDNDFRQFGIIKNVSLFNERRFFNGRIGHFTWLVYSSDLRPEIFPPDTPVKRMDGSEYIVVSRSIDRVLLVDISGRGLNPTDILYHESGLFFTCDSLVEPELDKWSGTMVLMDNRTRFAASPEEKLAFRTTITY